MKMVQLMAKLVQERIHEKDPLAIRFDVIPQFLTPYQRHRLQVDILPLPIGLRWFTSAEVACLCGVHRRTVTKWAQKGWIKPYRPCKNEAYYRGYELLSFERYLKIVAR